MELILTRAKQIFTRTGIPGADFAVNVYAGCSFACSYCYARFICRFKPYGEWGNWVEAKVNAPELVKGKKVRGKVVMSTISDAYQPVEAELNLTGRVLRNMSRDIKLDILTKSPLILRDVELLKEFKNLSVGFTLSFEGELKRELEPKAPAISARINALKKLKKEGIRTYGFISPVVPGLTDVENLIEKIRDFVDYFWIEMINVDAAGKEFAEKVGRIPTRKELVRYAKELTNLRREVKIEEVVLHPWRVL